MKHTHYIYMAAAMLAFATVNTACMDSGWDDEQPRYSAPFGNNSLQATNIVTIAELKTQYKDVVFASTDTYKQITDDVQLLVRVTGNDLGGNIYKQFTLQDETGAIIIAVNQNGLNGYLAEGQLVLVDLKDLYIGGYRKQPEIGQPYNGSSIGRMSKDIWDKHFKLLNDVNPNAIAPVDFNSIKNDMDLNCGKLVVLKNVTFAEANGKNTFAPNDGQLSGGNNVNRTLTGMGSNVVVRTSTYADFAAMALPYDTEAKKPVPCNITGIATRYNATWQILIRKTSDIEIIQ